jgi:hypothetical protein
MQIPEALWRALENLAFFTVPQAAQLLGCDERTLRKACARWAAGDTEGVPGTRVGVTWRIPTSWLRDQVTPPARVA